MKELLGVIGVFVLLLSYVFYFRGIAQGKTKPHAITWLIWAVFTSIALAGQISADAGPSTWILAAAVFMQIVVLIFALFKGEKEITRFDWLSLAGAGLALGIWLITSDPLLAVILAALIDSIGYLPTLRKSFRKPHEETAMTYFLGGIDHAIGLLAMNNYRFVSWFYVAVIMMMNFITVVWLLWRRKVLDRISA